MAYKIKFFRDAEKAFDKLDKSIQKRITKYLFSKVINDPFSYGKPLTANLSGLWRYRVGDYRIVCEIQKEELVIIVVDLGHRSTIY
jgi:mRNA interferase RelE/StbE